jgi:drug/metabolite transporter (DMT)-like permease
MYSYFQPILATALSIILGVDALTWQKILATVLVVSGVVLVSKSRAL